MRGALDTLQMKEEAAVKFLAAGTHLSGTNFDFKWNNSSTKSDSICIINLKGTWEMLLLSPRAIVALENPAAVSAYFPGVPASEVCSFAADARATPVAGRFAPRTFVGPEPVSLPQPWFLVVTYCRADHQPLAHASRVARLPVPVSHTLSSERGEHCQPKGQGSSLGAPAVVKAGAEVARTRGPVSRERPRAAGRGLGLLPDPDRTGEREAATAQKAGTKERCGVSRLPWLPRSLLFSPSSQTGPKAEGTPVLLWPPTVRTTSEGP